MLGEAVHRIVLTGDAEASGMLEDDAKVRMRKIIYAAFQAGFEAAGIGELDRSQEDRGDGILAVLTPGVPAGRLLGPWLQSAYWTLRDLNQGLQVPVRLRVAMHVGAVRRDANGLVGRAVDLTCRLSDSTEAKSVLRRAPGAYLLLIVSDALYESGVRGGGPQIERENFVPGTVSTKEGRQIAWFHVPGRATPPVDADPPPDANSAAPAAGPPAPPDARPGPPAAAPQPGKYGITVHGGVSHVWDGNTFHGPVSPGGSGAAR